VAGLPQHLLPHPQGNVVDFDRTAADVDEVTLFALGDVPVVLAAGDFAFA
jgi:hypothetical protein